MTDSLELAQGRRDEAEMMRRAAMTATGRIEAPQPRFHMLIEQGQRAAKELHLTRRALATSPRLKAAPEVAQRLLEAAIGEYVASVGALEGQAAARLELEAGNLEYRREQRAAQRTAFVAASFKNVPQGALEFFRGQVARMNDAQRLEAYRLGQDWQKLVLAEGHTRAAATPNDGSGTAILAAQRGTREQAELSGLIRADQLRGYKAGDGYITLPTEEALDAEERALESARHEIKMIDDVGYHLDLSTRYKLGDLPEPEFDARLVQMRQFSLEQAAGKLGSAVPTEAPHG